MMFAGFQMPNSPALQSCGHESGRWVVGKLYQAFKLCWTLDADYTSVGSGGYCSIAQVCTSLLGDLINM